ncbi:MAG: radical SAM protein [Desulfobacterales bacterium]|nr:radical SAM protein [Desulfobacterales bacterium]
MKAVFIIPNRNFVIDNNGRKAKQPARVPASALSVIGALEANGFETELIDTVDEGFDNEIEVSRDFYQFGMRDEDVIEKIARSNADVIMCTSMFTSEQACVDTLCKNIKNEFPEKPLILGGLHATLRPEWHFEKVHYDAIVLGDGEEIVVDLMKRIEMKTIQSTKNVAVKTDTGIYFEKRRPHIDISKWDWGIDTVLIKPDGSFRYIEKRHDSPIDSLYRPEKPSKSFILLNSRGCPFSCDYCGSTDKDGKRIRYRNFQKIISEVSYLYEKYGIRNFHNQADAFLLHQKDWEFLKFITEYRKTNPDLSIDNPNAFFLYLFFDKMNGYSLRTDLVDLLYDAGFSAITIAIETFSQRFNQKINFRKIPPEKVIDLLAYIRSKGMMTDVYMMYGFPGQTEDELKEDLNMIDKMRDYLDSLFYRSLLLFPGTTYYELYVGEKKKIKEIDYKAALNNGYCFGHMPKNFNLTQIPYDRLTSLTKNISFVDP